MTARPTSSAANPTHTYTTVGAKTAVLTVTDDEGATSTSSVVITPSVNQAPTAVANGAPLRGVFPLTVSFSSAGSVDSDCSFLNDCPGLTYAWDFGDGETSTEANPEHIYVDPDTYTATLTVTDNEGATATASVSVNVRNPNLPPVVQAAGVPTSGKEPLVVAFSSAGTADQEGDGSIVSYAWDFGDGGTSTSANPSHTYTSAGSYTATLTATDNDGGTATQTVSITVDPNQPPTAVAGSDVTGGQAPLEVNFNSTGSGDPDGTASYSWDFGGDGTSTDPNPTHTFNHAGHLRGRADRHRRQRCQRDLDGDHRRRPAEPGADRRGRQRRRPRASRRWSSHFDGSGSTDADGTVNSYDWDFGDGGDSSSATPSHTYTDAGHLLGDADGDRQPGCHRHGVGHDHGGRQRGADGAGGGHAGQRQGRVHDLLVRLDGLRRLRRHHHRLQLGLR